MIKVGNHVIADAEIKISFIRSPGPGGQNVNKVATAVLLRFNVRKSSLPKAIAERILLLAGPKLTTEGDLLIKASRYRTQKRNKQDALKRLQTILNEAAIPPKKRQKTAPSNAVRKRRLDKKKLHSKTKELRRIHTDEEG